MKPIKKELVTYNKQSLDKLANLKDTYDINTIVGYIPSSTFGDRWASGNI